MHTPKKPFIYPMRDGLWCVIELCDELLELDQDWYDVEDLERIKTYCYEALHVTRHGAQERLRFPDPAA